MSNNAPAEVGHKQILMMVKQLLRMSDTTDHDAFLTVLIDWAASRLNTTERTVPENCTVTIEDNRFQMPSDAKEVFAFRGVGTCFGGIFVDVNFFSQCNCSVPSGVNMFNVITKKGRWFYFLSQIPDSSEYEIAYTKVNRDCNGLMIINEECEQACAAYAAWQFANAFQNTMNYTNNQIQTWKTDYQTQAMKCRGNAAVRTKNQQRVQISSKFNAILCLDGVWSGAFFGSILPQFYYSQNPANPYGV